MYYDYEERQSKKMDSKARHPFAIMCRKCGSNDIEVRAFDLHNLEITCKDCGVCLNCGLYCTQAFDYSDMW